MTAMELFKFCNTSGVQYRWFDDDVGLMIWIDFNRLEEFTELLGYSYLRGGGIEVVLQEYCVVLKLNNLCEYFGIKTK